MTDSNVLAHRHSHRCACRGARLLRARCPPAASGCASTTSMRDASEQSAVFLGRVCAVTSPSFVLLTLSNIRHVSDYLCLRLSSLPHARCGEVLAGQPRRGNRAGSAERERTVLSDEQMQIRDTNGRGGGNQAVCKLDDDKEGRTEDEANGNVLEGRGGEGGVGSQLHWYEYDAEAEARATSPLLSSLRTRRERRLKEGRERAL